MIGGGRALWISAGTLPLTPRMADVAFTPELRDHFDIFGVGSPLHRRRDQG